MTGLSPTRPETPHVARFYNHNEYTRVIGEMHSNFFPWTSKCYRTRTSCFILVSVAEQSDSSRAWSVTLRNFLH